MASFNKPIFFLMAFITFIGSTHAYTFQVGGKYGWTLHPSENYNSWSARLRFLINDTLHFKYDGGSDSVLIVNKTNYDGCNANNPITKLDGGDSMFKFDRSGPFYFITGNKTNCDQGQKLMVVVLALRNRSPPPSVTTPPSSSTRPPSPVTSPVLPPSASHVSPPSPAGSPDLSPSISTVSPPSNGSPESSNTLTPPASSPGGQSADSPDGGVAGSPGGKGAGSPGGKGADSPDGGVAGSSGGEGADSPDGEIADSPDGEDADSPAYGSADSPGDDDRKSPGGSSPRSNVSNSPWSVATPPLCATIVASLVSMIFALWGLN